MDYLRDFEVGQGRALGSLLVVGPPPVQHLQELRVELFPQLGHVLAPKEIHLGESQRRGGTSLRALRVWNGGGWQR